MQGYLRPNQRSEQGLVFQHYSAVIEINRYTKQAKNRKGMQQTATKLTIFGSRAVIIHHIPGASISWDSVRLTRGRKVDSLSDRLYHFSLSYPL